MVKALGLCSPLPARSYDLAEHVWKNVKEKQNKNAQK